MSHDATAWARQQTAGSGTAKFVLMLLADQAGSDYSCWPSLAYLSGISELGESTIRSATKKLAELGLIRVYYRHRGNGLRRSCRYQLLVDGPETAEPDAEDWSSYRQISAEDNRSESAEDPLGSSASARSERAVIPYTEPSVREPSALNPGAARTARGTRLSEDFAPDEGLRKWYAAEQLEGAISGRIEHQRFMNYWLSKPGAAGRKTDWRRTWMNWMLGAAQRSGGRPGAPAQYKPSTTDQRVAQGMALAEKFRQMEENA